MQTPLAWRRIAVWTALITLGHLVLTGIAILGSFGAGMARFDNPDAQSGLQDRVFGALATVLPQPALCLLEWSGARGLSPLLQWTILGANSVLWAAVLAWIALRLMRSKRS